MAVREVVYIDEEKCDGCGECVPSCEEGAIQIVNGKAKLVADVYCDGLGACLGHCPQDAIKIIQREAVEFDEAAVEDHLAKIRPSANSEPVQCGCPGSAMQDLRPATSAPAHGGGCPGAAMKNLKLNVLNSGPALRPTSDDTVDGERPSALGHWPIQLGLVPPHAPFLQGADVLLVADCVPFAMPDFHERYLRNKPVVIGCPKLDSVEPYIAKMAAMITQSGIKSITVVHMEVPCCTGLVRVAEAALHHTGNTIPLHDVVVSIRGKVLSEA